VTFSIAAQTNKQATEHAALCRRRPLQACETPQGQGLPGSHHVLSRPVFAFPRPWPPRPRACPGPCSCQLHPLASQWLTAKFRTASMLAVNFFRSRTKDSYCSSITRLPPSPSITPSHPYVVCFCCDSPSCFREGCYFLLIRPFQDDGDTAFSCCRSSPTNATRNAR
jgi:hypothetical protein